MPAFRYANPLDIFWGRKAVSQYLAAELNRLRVKGPVIVTTRSLREKARQLELRPASSPVTVVVSQHAPMTEIESAFNDALASDVDGVVSFGGGSAIDAGKIIALRLAEQYGIDDRGLRHIAIPTTLSAAELASGAGYTDADGTKAGMRDPRLLPNVVIYDPEVTLDTPMELWLSTGIRALDHAVEGCLAEGEHPFNDVMALEAIRRLFDSLPRAKADPRNLEVRQENQLAAWFSFTLPGASASGLSHVMGKQIGARHGIPHGVTSCLLLPHVMRYVGRKQTLPVGADDVEKLIADLGLPQHIAAYGIGEPELRAAASELAGKYPADDLLQIYTAAL
ncbi:MAG TPA: iron-containing alcohol dehydrogenase [Candidatus Dormibacteraeota bacterium]|nr:iron-containing alcohol dehydrogenase [Candidatus Dormibacteraeota bacterium]